MPAMLSFFPVDNGDMTLLTSESRRQLLIDLNIRAAADDPDDDTPCATHFEDLTRPRSQLPTTP